MPSSDVVIGLVEAVLGLSARTLTRAGRGRVEEPVER